MKKLNLGCGTDIKEGWINLDCVSLPGVDVVHDLTFLPLPFKEGEFDEIQCQSILEHLDYIPILKEIHRILKKSGGLKIMVPHFTSSINYIDPTHKRYFSIRTFEFFVKNNCRHYYFDFHFDRIEDSKIILDRGYDFGQPWLFRRFVGLLEKWVNSSRGKKCFYEDSFLSRIFPGRDIKVTLIK